MNGLTMRYMKKSKVTMRQMKINIQCPKSMGHNKSSPERYAPSITGLLYEVEKISNNLTLHITTLKE